MKQPPSLLLILFVLFLSACGSTSSVRNVSDLKPITGHTPAGTFKVGNPYRIFGKLYRPFETYNFTETGIASWYGPNFHGKYTANGEIFDMHDLTAAHRTLQMPSIVRVTNLENGRSLIVRVNDRGPFKRGRVIDLSYKAAGLLGFREQGTAKVAIQVLGEESRRVANMARRGMSTRGVEVAMNEGRLKGSKGLVTQASASDVPKPVFAEPPVQTAPPAPEIVQHVPVGDTRIYVQAGSFSEEANALKYAARLKAYGPAEVYPALVNGQNFYRVRMGPYPNVGPADTMLERLALSGHENAMIVVE